METISIEKCKDDLNSDIINVWKKYLISGTNVPSDDKIQLVRSCLCNSLARILLIEQTSANSSVDDLFDLYKSCIFENILHIEENAKKSKEARESTKEKL